MSYLYLYQNGNGGAIKIEEQASLTCTRVVFENNIGNNAGAIISTSSGRVNLLHTTLENNKANGWCGGAVSISSGTFKATNSTFATNYKNKQKN